MNKNLLVFFFVVTFSQREAEAGRGTKEEAQREREREKEESGGGTQRGKWCSKHFPGSIPGSTLREIIHPKTTHRDRNILFGIEIEIFYLG